MSRKRDEQRRRAVAAGIEQALGDKVICLACGATLATYGDKMPLVGADEARVRSLEPQARLVEQLSGQKVSLRRFSNAEEARS